ncbi:MAG: hypothetical protein WC458_01750 [Patescibacteria group bacterium]|jgi:hypothetical protein
MEKKVKISTTYPMVQQPGKGAKPFKGEYKASSGLEKILKELIAKTDTSQLPISFYKKKIKSLAAKKGLRIKTLQTGDSDPHTSSCSIRSNYWSQSEKQHMSIHVWDVEEDGTVKINWNIVIIFSTNKIYLHPDFFRGYNDGFLEKLGLVKKVPPLPDLPEKVIQGKDFPSLTSKEEEKTLFLLSEIKERLDNVKRQHQLIEEQLSVL